MRRSSRSVSSRNRLIHMKLTFKDDGDKIKANIIGVDLVFEKQ